MLRGSWKENGNEDSNPGRTETEPALFPKSFEAFIITFLNVLQKIKK